LWLGINYADASDALRNSMLNRSPCSIVQDKWYTLEFEVRGQHLRGYLDGKLMIEATDERLPKGGVGLTAWRSRVLVDDFSVRLLP
jgi:pectate lyase